MKIVVIDGIQNPRTSMTRVLLDNCLQGMRDKNPEISIRHVALANSSIEFCMGCKSCGIADGEPLGRCMFKDGVENILQDMLAADRIILVSPIYDFTVSALMIRFLERTLPLCEYPKDSWPRRRNKTQPGKRGLILLASDCPAPLNWMIGVTWHASLLLRSLCKSVGCAKTLVIAAGGMHAKEKVREKFAKEAYRRGQELVEI